MACRKLLPPAPAGVKERRSAGRLAVRERPDCHWGRVFESMSGAVETKRSNRAGRIRPLRLSALAGAAAVVMGTAPAFMGAAPALAQLTLGGAVDPANPPPIPKVTPAPAAPRKPAAPKPAAPDAATPAPGAAAPQPEAGAAAGPHTPSGDVISATPPAPPEQRLSNPVAVFSGLDKITGRIISFDAYIDETVQFGALRVTPRACYTRPATETPRTDAFIEVDEITLDNKVRRIFTGWMFAASPGLNAVDHPIYDVWLTDCRLSSQVPPPDGFDTSRFTTEGLDLIPRPQGWVPEPLPRPDMAGAGTDAGDSAPAPDSSDQPED